MSQFSGGPGWWQASDGNWYPPEQHPSKQSAAPALAGPYGPGWWQASDGNWYPPQSAPGMPHAPPQWAGAPPGAKRPGGIAKGCLVSLAIVGVLVVGVIVIIAVAANHAAKQFNSNAAFGNLGGAAPAAKYSVGQTATTGPFLVTVFAVQDPYVSSNQLSQPPTGEHLVEVDVQLINPGSNQRAFSSLLGFHLYDSANHKYLEDPTVGVSPRPPDGQIPGGQNLRGFVVFSVPDGTSGLRLRVQGSPTAAGAVFRLS